MLMMVGMTVMMVPMNPITAWQLRMSVWTVLKLRLTLLTMEATIAQMVRMNQPTTKVIGSSVKATIVSRSNSSMTARSIVRMGMMSIKRASQAISIATNMRRA